MALLTLVSSVIVHTLMAVLSVHVMQVAAAGGDVSESLRVPDWVDARLQHDTVAYPAHVAMARSFALTQASPVAEGLQWLKAAAHATSDEQVRTISGGLASAIARAGAEQEQAVAAQLCEAARRASQVGHSLAVALSGMNCDIELRILGHVPEGQPVYYWHNPPIGGPHYSTPYPVYGVAPEPVPAGYWVENLERGAIVLLYQCEADCSSLVARLRELYASLPPSRHTPGGNPRLLAVRDTGMPSPLAAVTWGEAMLLDHLDPDRIRDFYISHVDRGPACQDQHCPP